MLTRNDLNTLYEWAKDTDFPCKKAPTIDGYSNKVIDYYWLKSVKKSTIIRQKYNVVFEAQENFFLIGFNKLDDYDWEGRLIDDDEKLLNLKSIYDQPRPVTHRCFILCFGGNPIVNGKEFKRYDYSELFYPKEYHINLNGGVLGFFKKLC